MSVGFIFICSLLFKATLALTQELPQRRSFIHSFMQITGNQHTRDDMSVKASEVLSLCASQGSCISPKSCQTRIQSFSTDGLEMGSRWRGCFRSPLVSPRAQVSPYCLWTASEFLPERHYLDLERAAVFTDLLPRVGSSSDLWWTYCHSAHAFQLLSCDSYVSLCEDTHTQNTISRRGALAIDCTLCTLGTARAQIPHRNTNSMSWSRSMTKNCVLCFTTLRVLMLISMCPPHHHSGWLDWPLVRVTRGNLCLTGGSRNKSQTLGSAERSTNDHPLHIHTNSWQICHVQRTEGMKENKSARCCSWICSVIVAVV